MMQAKQRAHQPNQQAETEGENKPRKLPLRALAASYYYRIMIREGTELDPFADGSSAISIGHQQKLAPGTKPAKSTSNISMNEEKTAKSGGVRACVDAHSRFNSSAFAHITGQTNNPYVFNTRQIICPFDH